MLNQIADGRCEDLALMGLGRAGLLVAIEVLRSVNDCREGHRDSRFGQTITHSGVVVAGNG